MVVSQFRTYYVSVYGGLTHGSAELEEVTSLRTLRATFDSKFTFETHFREVVSKAARSLGVVLSARSSFICPRVLHVVSMNMFCPSSSIVPLV